MNQAQTNVVLMAYDPKTELTRTITTLVNNYSDYPSQNKSVVANNFLFFHKYNSNSGWELWKTNGTIVGTSYLSPAHLNFYSSTPLYAFNNELYYGVDDGTDIELRKTNGFNITSLQCLNRSYVTATKMNDSLYFSLDACNSGRGLWRLDSAQVNPVEVFNSNGNNFDFGAAANDQLYFVLNDRTTDSGRVLWRTDGTNANTTLVSDINPSYNDRYESMIVSRGSIFFTANDGNGQQLWQSDGTDTGTSAVTSFPSPSRYSRNVKIINSEKVEL